MLARVVLASLKQTVEFSKCLPRINAHRRVLLALSLAVSRSLCGESGRKAKVQKFGLCIQLS